MLIVDVPVALFLHLPVGLQVLFADPCILPPEVLQALRVHGSHILGSLEFGKVGLRLDPLLPVGNVSLIAIIRYIMEETAETGHGIDLPVVIAYVGADLRHPHQLSVEQHILRFRDLPEDCRPVKDLLQGLLDQSRDQLRFMAFNGCFHRSFLYPQEPGGSLFLFINVRKGPGTGRRPVWTRRFRRCRPDDRCDRRYPRTPYSSAR